MNSRLSAYTQWVGEKCIGGPEASPFIKVAPLQKSLIFIREINRLFSIMKCWPLGCGSRRTTCHFSPGNRLSSFLLLSGHNGCKAPGYREWIPWTITAAMHLVGRQSSRASRRESATMMHHAASKIYPPAPVTPSMQDITHPRHPPYFGPYASRPQECESRAD